MTVFTELTLDVDKWICGAHQKYCHGLGTTELCNAENFMCCLGQFAQQAGFPVSALKYKALLTEIKTELKDTIPFSQFLIKVDDQYVTTPLADQLLNINDHAYVTLRERVNLLKKALASNGITLHVIDKHNHLNPIESDHV